MSERDSILEMLKTGPVPTRSLRGRKGPFRLAYRQLLQAGEIVERGSGTKQSPKYVGLPGAIFPARRLTIKKVDVRLLVRAGATEKEAKATLRNAIKAGGEAEVAKVCEAASQKLLSQGVNPYRLAVKPGRPLKDVPAPVVEL